jgi:hypothetical protein
VKKIVVIVGGAAALVGILHVAGAWAAKKQEESEASTVHAHM